MGSGYLIVRAEHSGRGRRLGRLGLVLFVLAMYAARASAVEDATGQTVLPFGRHGKGKIVMRGSLLEQVKDARTEAGVRAQL